MFPEIVRDEVFRLETRRLWLRWPTMADAFDGPAPKTVPPRHAEADLRWPGSAYIATWRAANEAGTALHLAVEDKRSRSGIGSVHLGLGQAGRGLLDVRLPPARFGDGMATEAVQIVVHTAFLLRATPCITALWSAGDHRGRDTFERCGFRLVDAPDGLDGGHGDPSRPVRFALDRRDWAAQRGWSAPRVTRPLSRFAPPPACWSMPA